MTPLKIAEKIEIRLGVDASPTPLKSAIELVLHTEFLLPAIQAAERSERVVDAVARMIADRSATKEATGHLPILALVGSAGDVVCGSCYVLPADVPAVASAKANRIHAQALLTEMKKLSFAQFERFGAAVLRELGVQNPNITTHSDDQGIDFYGDFSFGQLQGAPAPFFKLAHDVTFAFAGQAKHYPTRSIGPDTVRELIGAISLARTKTYSKATIDLFENIAVKPFSPLLAMLFTTGDITSGATQLSEAAGIIARSGNQLALYLADRGVGIESTSAGKSFNPMLFEAWLNT